MPQPHHPTRWAVLGAGSIAREWVKALKTCDPACERHRFVAVASRSTDKARKFIEQAGLRNEVRACSYDQLYADREIDVIYVATINREHKATVLSALSAGHNVLCEKPLGVNADEVREMNELAKKKGVFLMEGHWSTFFPGAEDLKRLELGTLRCIQVSFCKHHPAMSSALIDPLGGGGMMYACGYYIVALAVSLIGAEAEVSDVSAVCTRDSIGTDATTQFSFRLGSALVQGFTSTELESNNEALIVGENGTARLPTGFHAPLSLETYKPSLRREYDYGSKKNGFIFQADHVRDCLLSGKTHSDLWSPQHAHSTAKILEKVRQTAGINFPQDA